MLEEIRKDPRAKRSGRKLALQASTIALFFLAIAFFLQRYSSDFSSLWQLSASDIAVIGAWSFVSYTAYAYAAYVVMLDLGLRGLTPAGWIKLYFLSRLVNFFITQGGNLYRLFVLKKSYDFSYTNTVGVTGFLIWINALVALALSISVLSFSEQSYTLYGRGLIFWCVLLAFALAVIPHAVGVLANAVRSSKSAQSKLVIPFLKISQFTLNTLRNTRLFAVILVLCFAHFGLFLGVNYYSFEAIGYSIDLSVVCVFTLTCVFTRYINIVPGNIGVSELVGGLISEQMGVGFANGLIVTGIVRMVEILVILLTGLVHWKDVQFSLPRRH